MGCASSGNFFNSERGLGVHVVFLATRAQDRCNPSVARVHNTPIVFRSRGQNYRKTILDQKLDLLLGVDYRPRYRPILEILWNTPIIVWVQDPRPPQIQARVASLRLDVSPHAHEELKLLIAGRFLFLEISACDRAVPCCLQHRRRRLARRLEMRMASRVLNALSSHTLSPLTR